MRIEKLFQTQTHQQILWFDVSVNNVQTVKVLDGAGQVEQHTAGISLRVFIGGGDGVKEISPLMGTDENKNCFMCLNN